MDLLIFQRDLSSGAHKSRKIHRFKHTPTDIHQGILNFNTGDREKTQLLHMLLTLPVVVSSCYRRCWEGKGICVVSLNYTVSSETGI